MGPTGELQFGEGVGLMLFTHPEAVRRLRSFDVSLYFGTG